MFKVHSCSRLSFRLIVRDRPMRRFLSITAIAAVICSTSAPLLAAACPHSQAARTCHGKQVEHPHCAMIHRHQAEDATPPYESAEIQIGRSATDCPMDCCAASHPQGIAAAAVISMSPSLIDTEQNLAWSPIIFTRNGFSSHTDRGPPHE